MKYIIFAPTFQPSAAMWKEIVKNNNTWFYTYPFSIKHIPWIYKHIRSSKAFLKIFLRRIPVEPKENVIFIYQNPWAVFFAESDLVQYFRKKYKYSMHVVRLGDVHNARTLNMKYLKSIFDDISIYDKQEALNLDINYFPACYSKNFDVPATEDEVYDLAFVGQAKNRLEDLIKVYEHCNKNGITCKFYVVGVERSLQLHKDGITYSNRILDETTYFNEYIKKSKCMLELTLENTLAITARVREAIIYDKKVISNNIELKNYPFYNSNMMKIISSPKEIDKDFFAKKRISYGYNGEFSPLNYIEYLNQKYATLFPDI